MQPEPQTKTNLDSDDDFGPALPSSQQASGTHASHTGSGPGPTIPTTSDILAQREQAFEDSKANRSDERTTMAQTRHLHQQAHLSALDSLAPRPAPGTREAQLEKKREANFSNRAFASSAHDAGDVEVKEADAMGDEDSLGELKRMKGQQERKKNEREIRREEMMRARRAEREEKLKGLREKEEQTMEMLKEIARQRFGDGEG